MALPKCTVPDNVIGSLANRPYEMGMSAQELKDKFDEMPEGIKKYLNEELVPALDEHLADIAINVRDFGAIGDGVADDSTPIQNAINHVESLGGGTVLLPNGTYLVKKSLLLPSNIHFKGNGKGTVIKGDFGSLVDPVLIGIKNCDTATGYDAAENITISDIAIDSPNTNGIGLAHAKNIKIYNIYGISVYWHFVDISGCQNVILDRIFAEGEAISSPIQFDNLTNDGGLKIFDGVSEKNANVDGTVIDNAVLTNSIIEQTSTTNYGINLHRSGGRNITIKDCTITGSMHGIYQDENTQWENVVVDNVRFFNQHVRAVWFRPKVSAPIEQNKNLRIINCVAEGFGYQGFVVDGWTDVLIDKCIANGLYDSDYGPSYTNISIWHSPNSIVSNVILGGEYKSLYGMRVAMPSSKNVIITNSIIKNADIGLFVAEEAETIHAGLLFVDVDMPIALIGGGTIGSYPISTS